MIDRCRALRNIALRGAVKHTIFVSLIVRIPRDLHLGQLEGKLPATLALGGATVLFLVLADNVLLASNRVDNAAKLVPLAIDAFFLTIINSDTSVASLQSSTRLVHFVDGVSIAREQFLVSIGKAVASIVQILLQTGRTRILLQEKYHLQNLLELLSSTLLANLIRIEPAFLA